jgi:hypothetical protein
MDSTLLSILANFQGFISFQTKNPNLGKFWSALDRKMLRYGMAICNILRAFGIFYNRMVHFVFIWYIFSGFDTTCQEKSGSPANVCDKNPSMTVGRLWLVQNIIIK